MEAVSGALERAGAAPGDVSSFGHGMTVATNALLEERGARTALIATQGFTDVLELARQTRPHLYRLCEAALHPRAPELRFGALERNSPRAAHALDEAALGRLLDRLAEQEVESVAICLLHSWARPGHERRVAEAVTERCPGCTSLPRTTCWPSSEYERTSTTVIDAYLSPLLAGYLNRLSAAQPAPACRRRRSCDRTAAWHPLRRPAATPPGPCCRDRRPGQSAPRAPASLSGSDRVLSFDMGGTSCDVAVIDDGVVRQSSEQEIGGQALQLPMVDIPRPVGAEQHRMGGRRRRPARRPRSAWRDAGAGGLRTRRPDPTVTDANLLLGYLNPEAPLAGASPRSGGCPRRGRDPGR